MTIANTLISRTPIFGKMFFYSNEPDKKSVGDWPRLMIMASFVWLSVALLLGLSMPLLQFLGLDAGYYYMALTAHGGAMAFPFLFQFMVGLSMHRMAKCMGKYATGIFPALCFWFINIGSILFTISVLMGLKMSFVVMYPLPIVGVENGQWSMASVIVGFTGIALLLIAMILLYPVQILKMVYLGDPNQELLDSERGISDPGTLGMTLSAFVLLLMGLPLLVVASAVLLFLYKIVPFAWIAWAADPMVFQVVFYLFAHNMMESIAIMVISVVYSILPLYLANGTKKLYSDLLAKAALWILMFSTATSFIHHFFTMFPAMPAALAYHGQVMSWAVGISGALSISTIAATIWKNGICLAPPIKAILFGFALYILDGVSALITSNIAWNFKLHGTMWQAGHTMAVLLAITLMFFGAVFHHFKSLTGRSLNEKAANLFIYFYVFAVMGTNYSFLAAGAAGMPRRFAEWNQDGYMVYGYAILFFGILLLISFVLFFYSMLARKEPSEGSSIRIPQPAE